MNTILLELNSLLNKLEFPLTFEQEGSIVISKSPESQISIKNNTNNSLYIFDEKIINQNYRLSKECTDKNIRLIVSVDRLFWTKFDKIIINEFFYSLQENAYLVFINSPKFRNTEQCLKKQLFDDYKGSFKFVSTTEIADCEIVAFQKTSVPRVAESDIKKWTFGFIGNGKKDKFIAEQIERIKKLPLKEWEVIICGTYNLSIDHENVKYIHFTENDNKGWITKKKNLIAQAASYENLIILHDRYIIPEDFVEKMDEWGNDFELLGAKQFLYRSPLRIYPARIQDWMMSPYGVQLDKDVRWKFSYFFLEYDDWDILAYIAGGIFIVKKSLMLKVPQDEDMFWYSPEDIKFCQDFTTNGYCLRINTELQFETVSFAHAVEEIPHRIIDTNRYLDRTNGYFSSLYIYEGFIEKLMPGYMEMKYEIETTSALKVIFGNNIPCYILHANPIENIKSINDIFVWYYKLMTIDSIRITFCQMSVEDKIKTMHKLVLRRPIADENLLAAIVKNFKTVHYFDERAFLQSLLETGQVQMRLKNLSVPDYPFEKVKDMLHIKIALVLKPVAVRLIKTLYHRPKLYKFLADTAKLFFKIIAELSSSKSQLEESSDKQSFRYF
jgi:hypothetical protein